MFKSTIINEDATIFIPYWKEEKWLSLKWEEKENWNDVIKRYKITSYTNFQEFLGLEEDEEKEGLYPYSVSIYQVETDEGSFFLVSKDEITSFEDIEHSVCLRYSYFNIMAFFKEMCIPFVNH